ncbi:hypothetical protein [Mycobacterium fragae]|uniref:hypothetical protein n=1 Tax=Mycobacterium fragae TaxID=1260918 RepID=UPI0021F306E0|nr:hypothetical protein [Mycobacterium fragae]
MNHIGIRSRLALLAVAVAAVMAASCSTSTAAAQPAAHGVEAPIDTIPWSHVGPGWMLAEWTPATSHRPGEMPAPNEPTWDKVATTLYLVDPAGGRYPIITFPPGSTARLVDWSGDRSRALFDVAKPGSMTGGTVISVDLRNGKQIAFPVGKGGPIGYARPDGTAVLINQGRYRDDPGLLERVDLAGKPELTYPLGKDYTGGVLATPDGAQLVLGTSKGLALMGNDGTPGKELPVPGKLSTCSPIRWWSSTVVLARCRDATRFSSAGQLWQVPIDGTAPTALTAVNSAQGDDPGFAGDYGDVDAWQLPSGTFLQSLGACGTMFLSRLTPDGHTTRVKVPGVSSSVHVNGVSGDKLVLVAKAGCGGGTSLLTYDPVANTHTVLLGPTVNGGSVVEAIVYPSQK